MLLSAFIEKLQQLDGNVGIVFGLPNDEWTDPEIEPTEDVDTGEYYYRIVGK